MQISDKVDMRQKTTQALFCTVYLVVYISYAMQPFVFLYDAVIYTETREMTQQFKVLTVLPKNLSLVPSTYLRQLASTCNSNSSVEIEQRLFSGLNKYTCTHKYTHIHTT